MKIFKAMAITAVCAAAACAFAFAGCGGDEDQTTEVTLASLSLDTAEVKVAYEVGEAFTAQGLKVSAVYSDESTKQLAASDYTLTPPDLTSVGSKEVKISYTEEETTVTASYNVTVSEKGTVTPPQSSLLELDLSGVQLEYSAGETFSAEGLKVIYKGGESDTELSQGDYTLSAPTFEGAGVYTVTIGYEEQTVSYTVAVIPDVAEDMTIHFVSKDENAALTLYITERTGGGVNTANATTKGLYIYKDASGYQAFNFDFSYIATAWTSVFNTVGMYETPFNDFWSEDNSALFAELGDEAKGVEAMRFKASGNEWHTKVLGWTEVASIDKVTIPADKVFAAGLPFDGTGIIIDYTLTNGEKGQITADNGNINNGTIQFFDCETRKSLREQGYVLSLGELEMRVMYDSKVYDVTINVTAGEASLTVSGGTREYLEGATPNAAGLTVTYIDENGEATQLTEGADGYTVTLPTAEQMAKAGSYEATVTYGSYSVSYDILVIPDVNWDTSKVDFGNQSGTGHRLELYVTERTGASSAEACTAKGYYVVKLADGGYEVYAFQVSYDPETGFTFTDADGVTSAINAEQGGRPEVTIGGTLYAADTAYWQRNAMGWN